MINKKYVPEIKNNLEYKTVEEKLKNKSRKIESYSKKIDKNENLNEEQKNKAKENLVKKINKETWDVKSALDKVEAVIEWHKTTLSNVHEIKSKILAEDFLIKRARWWNFYEYCKLVSCPIRNHESIDERFFFFFWPIRELMQEFQNKIDMMRDPTIKEITDLEKQFSHLVVHLAPRTWKTLAACHFFAFISWLYPKYRMLYTSFTKKNWIIFMDTFNTIVNTKYHRLIFPNIEYSGLSWKSENIGFYDKSTPDYIWRNWQLDVWSQFSSKKWEWFDIIMWDDYYAEETKAQEWATLEKIHMRRWDLFSRLETWNRWWIDKLFLEIFQRLSEFDLWFVIQREIDESKRLWKDPETILKRRKELWIIMSYEQLREKWFILVNNIRVINYPMYSVNKDWERTSNFLIDEKIDWEQLYNKKWEFIWQRFDLSRINAIIENVWEQKFETEYQQNPWKFNALWIDFLSSWKNYFASLITKNIDKFLPIISIDPWTSTNEQADSTWMVFCLLDVREEIMYEWPTFCWHYDDDNFLSKFLEFYKLIEEFYWIRPEYVLYENVTLNSDQTLRWDKLDDLIQQQSMWCEFVRMKPDWSKTYRINEFRTFANRWRIVNLSQNDPLFISLWETSTLMRNARDKLLKQCRTWDWQESKLRDVDDIIDAYAQLHQWFVKNKQKLIDNEIRKKQSQTIRELVYKSVWDKVVLEKDVVVVAWNESEIKKPKRDDLDKLRKIWKQLLK